MAKYKVANCKTFNCSGEILFRIKNNVVNPSATWVCNKCHTQYTYAEFYESAFRIGKRWFPPKKGSSQHKPKLNGSHKVLSNRDENNIFNRQNFLYFGIFVFVLTLICYIFKWKIPLFESYSAAFLFSTIILTCAGFYYFIFDKKYFASFGILFLMGGVIGMWQDGPSDGYLIPIFTGIYFLIIAFIPALLGIPLLLGGAYYLIASIYQAFRFGISYIAWYYWPVSIASILIGLWLLNRQKKLNK